MNINTINDSMTIPGGGTGAVLANRYRIVRQLGQGGMGSVWLAEDTQLDNKQFAIKMLPSILVSNKRAYRQLKDEALVAMKLTHQNIVTLRAFEENNGNPFLVMDYIEGQTLDDYLAEKEKLTEEETIRVLRPIAAALDHAHGEGVVHRDVKPANVMIRKDGHPYILDFGISREIQETLTRVTGKLSSGTLLYMSPEQLHGASPKKEQDIYSFAAMAYECLKGEPPFSRGQIEYQIDNDLPEPINSPSVMAGLAKKPEDRPPTCSAVLADGEGFSHKERRERKGGGAWKLILAMLVLGFAAVGGWWYYNQQKQEAARIAAARIAAAQRARAEAEQMAEKERLEAVRKAAAAEIRLEAKVQQDKVSRISSEDGFRARKDALEEVHSRAEALFNEKTRRWSEAAQGFSNYVVQCEALIGLDGERQTAVAARTKADRARNEAVEAKAEKYAATRWTETVKLLESARVDFGNMQFISAMRLFSSATEQFSKCVDEAKAECERQERAVREKRERQAVEAAEAERKKAENARRRDAEKPKVYLTATLNGVHKRALITEGMQENRKYSTPLNINVNIPIGTKGEFAAEYYEDGVKYVGKVEYTVKKGLQNVAIVLSREPEKRLPRPETLNFCPYCRYSLKIYDTVTLDMKCPSCGGKLLDN